MTIGGLLRLTLIELYFGDHQLSGESIDHVAMGFHHHLQPFIDLLTNLLMVPGINHSGMIQALEKRSDTIQFADPFVYFGLP